MTVSSTDGDNYVRLRLPSTAWSVQGTLPIRRTRYPFTICVFLLVKWTLAASTVLPAVLIWFTPGAAWFHHELIPSPFLSPNTLEARTRMAIWQLGNCMFVGPMLTPFLNILTFEHCRLSASGDAVVICIPRNKRCATRQSCWPGTHPRGESASNGDSRCEFHSSYDPSYSNSLSGNTVSYTSREHLPYY